MCGFYSGVVHPATPKTSVTQQRLWCHLALTRRSDVMTRGSFLWRRSVVISAEHGALFAPLRPLGV